MKKILLLSLLFAAALQAAPTPDPAEEQIKAVMKQFLGDPGAADARDLGRQILDYAEKTDAHEIEVSPAYLPWMGDKDAPQGSELLMVAFIAGDMLEQMKKGTSKSEPYSGILTMLEAYEKLRLKNPDFRVDSLKQFVDLERAGQLKAYVDKIRAEHPAPSAPSPAAN